MAETLLITGGAGFIGSHLAEGALRDGHRVIVIDNLSTGKRETSRRAPSSSSATCATRGSRS